MNNDVKALTADDYIKQGLKHESQKNYEAARGSYLKACELNSEKGWANLGTLYYQGNGVEKNKPKAYECYAAAEEGGHLRGKYMVAKMLASGDGVKQDIRAAEARFKALADVKYQDSAVQYQKLAQMVKESGTESVELDPVFSNPHLLRPIQQIPEGQVRFGKVLGSGAFGEVCMGTWQGAPVAIKRLHTMNEAQKQALLREAAALYNLNSPRVVHLYGIFLGESPFIVLEFVKWGSLDDLLKKQTHSWAVKIKWGADVAMGLGYIHENRMVHRDLKPVNILVDENGAKISDFGISKIGGIHYTTELNANPHVAGCTDWMAPEFMTNKRVRHTEASDIYSYGLILRAFTTHEEPNQKIDPLLAIPDDIPEILKTEIVRCLSVEPQDRPNAYDVATALYGYEEQKDFFSSTGLVDSDADSDEVRRGYLEYSQYHPTYAERLGDQSSLLYSRTRYQGVGKTSSVYSEDEDTFSLK